MVPDLTPNVGLFWYFFMEIFDHFKSFFLFIFQYHIIGKSFEYMSSNISTRMHMPKHVSMRVSIFLLEHHMSSNLFVHGFINVPNSNVNSYFNEFSNKCEHVCPCFGQRSSSSTACQASYFQCGLIYISTHTSILLQTPYFNQIPKHI
jgi:hypothetical protein